MMKQQKGIVLQNLELFFIQSFRSRATPHLVQVGTETKLTESASTMPRIATVDVYAWSRRRLSTTPSDLVSACYSSALVEHAPLLPRQRAASSNWGGEGKLSQFRSCMTMSCLLLFLPDRIVRIRLRQLKTARTQASKAVTRTRGQSAVW